MSSYHFEPLLHWGSALEVLGSGLDVEVDLLLTQVNHVGGEKRLAMLLEVSLISIKKTIQPWEELLGAVIGVEDNGDAVRGGDGSDVVSTSNTTSDRGLLLAVGNALLFVRTSNSLQQPVYLYLSGEVCSTSL